MHRSYTEHVDLLAPHIPSTPRTRRRICLDIKIREHTIQPFSITFLELPSILECLHYLLLKPFSTAFSSLLAPSFRDVVFRRHSQTVNGVA